MDAWIKRDDTPLGWPVLGRQAYFDDPAYERFDPHGRPQERDNASYIKRHGTINGLATGTRTAVIAGCRKSDLAVVRYAAAGPIVQRAVTSLPIPRVGHDPDASAVSDEYVEISGVLAAGARSNAVGAMNGTSVAAPQIARYIASQFEKASYGGRTVVQALAQYREGVHGGAIDPLRTGDGRIEDQLVSRGYKR